MSVVGDVLTHVSLSQRNPRRLSNEMRPAKTHGCVTPPHRTPEGTPCKPPAAPSAQLVLQLELGRCLCALSHVAKCIEVLRSQIQKVSVTVCLGMPFRAVWTCFKYALAVLVLVTLGSHHK